MDPQNESSVPSSSPDRPAFCLETSASIEEDMDTPGLLDEDTSEYVKQVMKTMNLRPDLLSEPLSFFPHLYHTYHLLFRTVSFRPPVHGLCGPAPGPCLTCLPGSERRVPALCTHPRLARQPYHCCLRFRGLLLREDVVL